MKRNILALIILLFTLNGFSQNLSLSWKEGNISNGDIIDISGRVDTLIYVDIELHNIGSTVIETKVRKQDIVEVPGSMNTFCFSVQCYPGTDTVSMLSVTINPGGSNNSFVGDYYPFGNVGVSTYRYTFFNVNDLNDTVSVTVRYSGTVGIEKGKDPVTVLSNAWPNPASDKVYFNYNTKVGVNTPYVLVVRDMAGRNVREMVIPSGNGVMEADVSDIENGVYFYSLLNANQVLFTRKLVIKK